MLAKGPIYEVTLSIDRTVAEDADNWLAAHIEEMLALPGFVSAETYEVESDLPDRLVRVVAYRLASDGALKDYLEGPATEMREATLRRFADRVTATRRILRPPPDGGEPVPMEACLNCGEPLLGQYCANCGQRARGRLISIWELLRDAIGDLFELDSRLWRTIIPLMFRPGLLTHDYLVGRRARFMPPFRTYLVLSIIFFLVAFFDPQQQFGILYEAEPQSSGAESTGGRTADEIRQQVLDDLAAEGIYVPGETAPAPPPAPGTEPGDESKARQGLNVQVEPDGGLNVACDLEDFDVSGPDWFTRRVTRERVQEVCENVTADSGREFLERLLDNIPAALFVLLPLMALILKMLYPLSKRYYVEHLLFVLHFHAFLFLILTLEVLFSRAASWARAPELVTNLSVFVVSLYVPLYLYKAMRRVYAQGRTITILKFFVLVLSYLIGLAFILVFAAFYTAFSI